MGMRTLDYVIFEELVGAPFWENVTHIVLTDWLTLTDDGTVMFSEGLGGFRLSALTLLEPLKEFLKKWSHLKPVWSLPDLVQVPLRQCRVRLFGANVLETFEALAKQFDLKMHALMLDTLWVPALGDSYRGLDTLKDIVLTLNIDWLWVQQLNGSALYDWHHRLFMEMFEPMVEYWTVKTFGFTQFEPVTHTEHGSYFKFSPVSESSCEDVCQVLFTLVNQWQIPKEKLLLYLSTTGAKYSVTKERQCYDFTALPLHEIRRLMCCRDPDTYHHEIDRAHGSSLLVLGDDTIVSYDDEMMRERKLLLARTFGGVMVGPLEDDLFPFHRQSLLATTLRIINLV